MTHAYLSLLPPPFFSFSSGKHKRIISFLSPIVQKFSTQSLCPLQSGDTFRVILLLVLNLWSLFFTVTVCCWLDRVTPSEMFYAMVGAGFHVLVSLPLWGSLCSRLCTNETYQFENCSQQNITCNIIIKVRKNLFLSSFYFFH